MIYQFADSLSSPSSTSAYSNSDAQDYLIYLEYLLGTFGSGPDEEHAVCAIGQLISNYP
jgi:hypothetical protein